MVGGNDRAGCGASLLGPNGAIRLHPPGSQDTPNEPQLASRALSQWPAALSLSRQNLAAFSGRRGTVFDRATARYETKFWKPIAARSSRLGRLGMFIKAPRS